MIVNATTGRVIDNHVVYARYLASYISDVSTIRARTIDAFGMAPERHEIEGMRANVAAPRPHDQGQWDCIIDPPEPPPEPPLFIPPAPVKVRTEYPIGPKGIICRIAEEMGSSYRDIVGPGRKASVTRIRFLIAALLVERGISYRGVGELIGKRDHKTIMSGCEQFRNMLKRDNQVREVYDKYCALWGLSGRFHR